MEGPAAEQFQDNTVGLPSAQLDVVVVGSSAAGEPFDGKPQGFDAKAFSVRFDLSLFGDDFYSSGVNFSGYRAARATRG